MKSNFEQGRRRKVSLAIPVYRNEGALSLTYSALVQLFADQLPSMDLEIVFVDDGSDDGSLTEIKELAAQDGRVRYLSFTRNFGQMAAMLCGLQEATGDAVILMSADMQDPVHLIKDMIDAWCAAADVVICFRQNREDRWSSRFSSWLFYRIVRFSIPKIPKGGFDFVLMSRKAVDSFNQVDNRNRFFQGDLLWMGYRTVMIPYTRLERRIGKSQYTFSKKLKNALDAVLDSSYLPVRAMSAVGAVTAILGFLYAIDIVIAKFVSHLPFPGWAPIMVTLLVIGGVLMMMVGVVGEYVWRIYDEVRKRPNYIIQRDE